ncbi:hypothetical protein NUW54_g13284 [Trametes sanguinea]|uniref:Uncharacterized protein n=1 Tax=Trametes sanguinea TaxID=158606 RepID=A0ACC1MMH7_9APHY|nr:hypothetical protein NUW54_g13284 [Trametes sanguinea]
MSKKEKPLHSLIAGTTAGAVEAFITYPTEYVKTRSQFSGKGPLIQRESPLNIIKTTLQTKGVLGLYSGCMALVIGNAVKAGVRFVSYDHFKHALADAEGKVSPPRSLLAGLGAGMMEAVFAVTPSETIKTKLIDDAKSPNPRFRGLIHGTTCIIREEGLRGIYRGLFPVMMRQGANSAVRFTTYTTLKQLVQSRNRPGQPVPLEPGPAGRANSPSHDVRANDPAGHEQSAFDTWGAPAHVGGHAGEADAWGSDGGGGSAGADDAWGEPTHHDGDNGEWGAPSGGDWGMPAPADDAWVP